MPAGPPQQASKQVAGMFCRGLASCQSSLQATRSMRISLPPLFQRALQAAGHVSQNVHQDVERPTSAEVSPASAASPLFHVNYRPPPLFHVNYRPPNSQLALLLPPVLAFSTVRRVCRLQKCRHRCQRECGEADVSPLKSISSEQYGYGACGRP